jgi:hypothetical protein
MLLDALSNLGLCCDRACGARRARRRLRAHPAARAGSRPRQRRPRATRRVLHGEHGRAVDSGARLRHSVRPRHLPAGRARRLAAGDAGGVADDTAIRGNSSGPRSPAPVGFRRHRRRSRRPFAMESGGARRRGRRTTLRSQAGADVTSTPCGCGPRARPDPVSLVDFNRG